MRKLTLVLLACIAAAPAFGQSIKKLDPALDAVIAPGGVRIITPAGKVLGQIIIPETVANVGFADDGKTVYLTGSTSLYRLHSAIPGEIPLYYKR